MNIEDIKILIGCEESQEICIAFRELGFEAYSCDIIECSGGHPEWHLKMDVFQAIDLIKPTLGIFHPPCTYLTISNNKAMTQGCSKYTKEEAVILRKEAVEFFMTFTKLDIKYTVIENPIGIMSSIYKKPEQIIQPWQFGHGETKATCLWIKNLPKLIPTNIVEEREQKIWKMPPSIERSKLRSKTYTGIAKAMAEQWGKYLLNI